MNHTSDTTAAGNGGNFDPQQAAALLDQTTLQARRQFSPAPPCSGVYGRSSSSSSSARSGCRCAASTPTSARPPRLIPLFIRACGRQLRRTHGRQARERRRERAIPARQAEIAVMAVAWIAAYAVMVPLAAPE